MSWDEGFPGARASRPHKTWYRLTHLLDPDRTATTPWLSCGLAAAVPARRVAACSIALKLSGGQRDRMRAGRPRSQAMPSQRWGAGCLAGDFSFGFKQVRPPPGRADHSRVKQRVLMPIRSRGHVPLMRFAASLNIDTQDRQDNQDEKLVHKKLIGSIFECAFVENLSVLRGPSRIPFESFPTPWDPFADSSFCSLNRSFSALGGNLFSLPNLWPIPLELSPTPSWPFVVLRAPSWISFFLAFVDNPQLFQTSPARALPGGRRRGRPGEGRRNPRSTVCYPPEL